MSLGGPPSPALSSASSPSLSSSSQVVSAHPPLSSAALETPVAPSEPVAVAQETTPTPSAQGSSAPSSSPSPPSSPPSSPLSSPNAQTQPPSQSEQRPAVRPWWRPPARNYRAHPGSQPGNPHLTTATPTAAPGTGTVASTLELPSSSDARLHTHSEGSLHYFFRAMNYVLRIPFRELIGNIARPYDPAAPEPLPDVPLNAAVSSYARQPSTNSHPGQQSITSGPVHGSTTLAATIESGVTPIPTTTRSWNYLPQIRKAWGDRTSDMSWAISTAFFTSLLCTMLATAALVLNWEADCTYLKVFLIAFVVRKWIVSYSMMDRALYRLPLGLVEPDPDIDDERHNAVALYMSSLFTWHGYVMLCCGSFYVFFYGASRFMAVAPVITGVSIAFSCMGLVPFFALLVLMLGALVLLYLFYVVFICLMWPLEKCSLSRRRAISRRHGGYQSDGITNTTDIRQIEEGMAANDNSRNRISGGGFARTSVIKETPAMAAIPIVIFRKQGTPPQGHGAMRVEIIKDASGHQGSPTANTDRPMTELDSEGSSSMASQGSGKGLATIVHIHDTDVDVRDNASHQTQHDASDPCSSTTALPHIDTPGTRSRASSSLSGNAGHTSASDVASQVVSTTSIAPCATSQEVSKPQDLPQTTDPNTQTSHPSDASQDRSSNRLSVGMSAPSGKFKWKKTQDNSLDMPTSVSHIPTSNGGGNDGKMASTTGNYVDDFRADYPKISDEECAICLFDFEDGDELRHLYCDHFFHRNCVDRWLTKHAFCPKCKRGI